MFRAHVVSAVWRRNVSSYFSGVLGYLFIAVFVVAASVLAFDEKFFVENQCNLDQLSERFPWLLLFIVPAVTMGTWSEERKLGTDELLFTLPATDFEILIAKYLSSLSIYTIALAFSAPLILVLAVLGDPDPRILLSTYLGYWLAGAALIAAGMFASVLTSSATVAFILGVLFAAIPVGMDYVGVVVNYVLDLVGRLVGSPGLGMSMGRDSLSVGGQLRDFTTGLVPLGGVAYFIGLACLFLYLNSVIIARRHWASSREGTKLTWQFAIRAVCLALIVTSGTYVLAMLGGRADLTSEKIYTLSPATRQVLDKIDAKRPVMLQAYISPRVPEDYVAVRKNLLTLLRQFQKSGGRKVDLRIVDTEPFSKEAEEATTAGIVRREVVSERSGRFTRDDVYLGVVASSGYDRVVIPYFEKGTPIEFELTRALGTVSKEKRPTVGILETAIQPMGGFSMSGQSPQWRLIQELRKQYTVKEIGAGTAIADDACDVLIAMLPSSLTQPEMENFVTYVKEGRPVLIFDDPAPYFIQGGLELAPSNPQKPGQGGGMFGMGAQPGAPKADGGEATSLMEALNLTWDVRDVLYDFENPHVEIAGVVPKTFVFINAARTKDSPSGLSADSPITKGLQEILVAFGGQIQAKNNSDFEFTPLMRTRKGSSGIVDFNKIFKASFSPFGGGGGREYDDRVVEVQRPDSREHIVAMQVKSEDKASPINAIFIADLDLVSNAMYQFWESETANLKLDNILFVYNCVDVLAGSTDYVALRNRRAEQRTLELIDDERKQFVNNAQKDAREAETKAEDALSAARKRMEEEIAKLQNDKSIDAGRLDARLRVLQETENRKLSLQEKEINRARDENIRKSKAESEQKIRAIERRSQIWSCLLPPIPAILVGFFMFFKRMSEEQRSIVSDRLVRR